MSQEKITWEVIKEALFKERRKLRNGSEDKRREKGAKTAKIKIVHENMCNYIVDSVFR